VKREVAKGDRSATGTAREALPLLPLLLLRANGAVGATAAPSSSPATASST
jgi:hypothetical protein